MLHYRRAEKADAVYLAPRLREADKREVRASLGMSPEMALPVSLETPGETWTMTDDDGEPLGLFGTAPVHSLPYFGIIWLVSTPALFEDPNNRVSFIRRTPEVFAMLHERFPLLGNHIDARNTTHIRWLRRNGFSMLRTIPEFGPERRPFHEFAKLKV